MDNEAKIKNASWAMRLLMVGGWTAACGAVWLLWVGGIVDTAESQGPDADTAIGVASCLATGCVGSVWFGVLLVALVVYGLVRRG